MHRPQLRRALAAAAALALAAGLAACGDDDDADESGAPDAEGVAVDDDDGDGDDGDEGGEGGEGGDTITVVAVDYAFEDLPEQVATGTRFELVNEAPGEVHEIVAIRIPDGEDRSVEELVALSPEEQGAVFGASMPAMVLVAPPGGEGFAAVGDGTIDESGRYAFICMIPTGADPDEFMAAAATSEGPPDVEGGPPHIVQGMWAEVLVD